MNRSSHPNRPNTWRAELVHDRSQPMLVAVSGGSDSIGLLHWLLEQHPDLQLHVATVDHGLRKESAQEAQFVKAHCAELGLPHLVTKWENAYSASSAAAREARYNLLLRMARSVGAPTIALGHTLDDQAETLVMRALRVKTHSSTRGLAGMSERATFNEIKLWRPLLGFRREQLRTKLRTSQTSWVDDPTNENTSYERVRVRAALANTVDELPDTEKLARLTQLSTRTRLWMNQAVVSEFKTQVHMIGENDFEYETLRGTEIALIQEALIWLILICGGLAHRSPQEKIQTFCLTTQNRGRETMTLGRCLLQTRDGRISVRRENRNRQNSPKPVDKQANQIARERYTAIPRGSNLVSSPCLDALENFRAEEDDCVYEAILDLLATAPCSA
ncbi:MAG: tRNA lysidine(34) synthetase TilS [Rhizobiaceae bacterium]